MWIAGKYAHRKAAFGQMPLQGQIQATSDINKVIFLHLHKKEYDLKLFVT